MTRAPETETRHPRQQVLIVDRDRALGALTEHLPGALAVENLFDAIGEVFSASARAPIGTVIIDSAALDDVGEDGAESIRRVDPSLRLILAGASPAPGFDDVLKLPPSRADIAAILEARPLSSTGADAGAPEPEDPARAVHDDDARPAPVSTRAPEPAAAPAPKPRPVPDEPLGDVDLVDSLLDESADVLEKALAIIRQQTGWTDLKLQAPDPTRDRTCCEVRHHDLHFGALTTAQATREELSAWADWLAKWMALDHRLHDLQLKAYTDELTGAWNRRFFREMLNRSIETARRRRRAVTVMVFDIDDFKQFNDQFGHTAGDEILRESVLLLNSVIRKSDHVCRIGGDEFAVIFSDPEGPREPGSEHPKTVEQIARRFQEQICLMRFPKLGMEAPGTLSISAGLATYPWDGTDPEGLLEHADLLALQSKRKGKNAITFGPGAKAVCSTSSDVPPRP